MNSMIETVNSLALDIKYSKAMIDKQERKFDEKERLAALQLEEELKSTRTLAKFPKSPYEDYPKRNAPGRAEYI